MLLTLLFACANNQNNNNNNDTGLGTVQPEDTGDSEIINEEDRQSAVYVLRNPSEDAENEYDNLQEALENVACEDGDVYVESDQVFDGIANFSEASVGCASTNGLFSNLNITSTSSSKGYLEPLTIQSSGELTMLDMSGGHEVSFDNVRLEGFQTDSDDVAAITGIYADQSELNVSNTTFQGLNTAINTGSNSVYTGKTNSFLDISGSAIKVGSNSNALIEYSIFNGRGLYQYMTDPVIQATDAESVNLLGSTLASYRSQTHFVEIGANNFEMYGNTFFDTTVHDSPIYMDSAATQDDLGIQTEADFRNNQVVNNKIDGSAVFEVGTTGTTIIANNTIGSNLSADGAGLDSIFLTTPSVDSNITITNNIVYGNALVSEEIVANADSDQIYTSYNIFHDNGTAEAEMDEIDAYNNYVCNPFESAESELEIYDYDENHFDFQTWKHDEGSCADSTGNPDGNYYNYYANHRGAFGGRDVDILTDAEVAANEAFGFSEE